MPSQPTVESPDPGMLLSGERRVLELIATGSPLAQTLDALCQAIDDQTSLTSAVYLLNREGDRFLLAAGPHLPQVWRDATCSYRADATIGTCGAAVHLRHDVIVPNVPDSALFDLWREAAAAAHIGSAWSTPFFSTDGRPLGTFAVFAHSSGDPDAQFVGVVGRATGLASIAVERHLTELELRESERRCSTAAKQMRALATRLMRVQDDERRRIAQTLHETTAQDLAGLKMLLARLVRSGLSVSDADRALLLESIDLAERSMSGVRTLSYLLHPPFLDENGLLSALRWYAKGFADRSGITVDLDLPATFGRLPQEVETGLFRVVQEALINTHRHAQSATASIRLTAAADLLTLEIEDRGRGMSPEVLSSVTMGGGAPGVGIAGMRERLEQLGGRLNIESSVRGTTIRATVPLQTRAS